MGCLFLFGGGRRIVVGMYGSCVEVSVENMSVVVVYFVLDFSW